MTIYFFFGIIVNVHLVSENDDDLAIGINVMCYQNWWKWIFSHYKNTISFKSVRNVRIFLIFLRNIKKYSDKNRTGFEHKYIL